MSVLRALIINVALWVGVVVFIFGCYVTSGKLLGGTFLLLLFAGTWYAVYNGDWDGDI